MPGVHGFDRIWETPEESIDAFGERVAGLVRPIGAAERTAGERSVVVHDHVARKQRGVGDEGEVVRSVPRRVHGLDRLVADRDVIPVGQRIGPERVLVEGVHGWIESLDDGFEFGDVIRVLVGEHDGVERRDPVADRVGDLWHRARVDQGRPIARNEMHVAGEYVRIRGHIMDLHTSVTGEGTKNVIRAGDFSASGAYTPIDMGFGSYDESEQERQSLDSDDMDGEEGVETAEYQHEGDIDFEIGASNDELLDKLQDIKE